MTGTGKTHRADVVIVGGGIIGCACAWQLAGNGLSVCLLERDTVASGASGACDGHLAVQTKSPGPQAELALESLELYRGLPSEFGQAAQFAQCGSVLIAEDETELDALQALAQSRLEAGIDVALLTGDQARVYEPHLASHVLAASYCAGDAQINPWRATMWFAEAAEKSGAQVLRGTPVDGLEQRDGCVRAFSGDRVFEGQYVVVAAGCWTPQICETLESLPIKPRRGEVLVTERLPRMIRGLVLSTSYLAKKFGDASVSRATLAVEQTRMGNVLIGGTRDFAGYDTGITPEGTSALAAAATRALPALAKVSVIRSFAGLRPYTPDGLPFVGPIDNSSRLVIAAGHEGDGITLAPVTAKLVAEYICAGHEPPGAIAPRDRLY